jgi:hypothetical protein
MKSWWVFTNDRRQYVVTAGWTMFWAFLILFIGRYQTPSNFVLSVVFQALFVYFAYGTFTQFRQAPKP